MIGAIWISAIAETTRIRPITTRSSIRENPRCAFLAFSLRFELTCISLTLAPSRRSRSQETNRQTRLRMWGESAFQTPGGDRRKWLLRLGLGGGDHRESRGPSFNWVEM